MPDRLSVYWYLYGCEKGCFLGVVTLLTDYVTNILLLYFPFKNRYSNFIKISKSCITYQIKQLDYFQIMYPIPLLFIYTLFTNINCFNE